MAQITKQAAADITLGFEHLNELVDRLLADAAHTEAVATADRRIGKKRPSILCPVTGEPTVGKRVFKGLGSDAKAKSAINDLLAGLEADAERTMADRGDGRPFADPARIRKAAAAAAAKGIEEIDKPSDWLRL